MKIRIIVPAMFMALFLAQGAYAQNTYYLPQVANGYYGGGSMRTTFIFFNKTNADATASLQLTDNGGNPLVAAIPGLGTGSQFSIPLAAGSSRIVQTDGTGSLVTGAATVTSTANIGVSAIFTIYDPNGNYLTESGVGSSDPLTEFVIPVDTTAVDTTGVYNTGLALFNVGSIDASITLILRGANGAEADRTTRTLNGGRHIATFVAGADQFFPALGSFQGTLLVRSSAPVAALVLRQNDRPLSYTSLPVVPTSATRTTLNLAHWVNGTFDKGSYKTSFLLFNISPTAANITLSLTDNNGNPLVVTIPDLGTGSQFSITLAAGGSRIVQTDGLGALASGAARIASDMPIGASGIFTIYDNLGAFTTEAGVGDSPVYTAFTLPVYIIGRLDTGVAFFNPGVSTATLTFRLLDPSGVLVGSSAVRNVPGNGHMAEFISQIFDTIFPAAGNFWGSVAITSTAGVSAMTLRENLEPHSYTTLPIASGMSNGKAAIPPLLAKMQTGITALSNDPNVVVNETLLPGFRLSGTVSGAGLGVQVIADAGGNNTFAGTVDPLTGKYLIIVPAGTYTVKACYQPAGAPSAVTLTYVDPAAVPVAGDTTRDMTLPAVTLFTVSGTVSGLSGLPSGTITTILFTSGNQTMQGKFTLDAGGNYQGALPAGTYVASVGREPIQFLLLQSESLQLYNLGSLTVAGGPAAGNYTIPATAMLSGTISGASLSAIPPGTSITATDASAAPITQSNCCAFPTTSSATTNLAGQYQMVLAQGRNYAVGTSVPFTLGVNLFSAISYPVNPAGSVSLVGDTVLNLVIPSRPYNAVIGGRVRDNSGKGIANVVVTVYSQSIQDAAHMGFTAMGITNSAGDYSIGVLSGTSYQVTFVPPAPGK
jgi:hypothetical protein